MDIDFSSIYSLLGYLPFDCLETQFMQQALFALLLLSPMTAMLGIHVQNLRMSFFSDAVGHSAFAGIAIGLILGLPLQPTLLIFGILTGIFIVTVQRQSNLSEDAAIGIVFSAVVAFGLAVVSRSPDLGREIQQYLYGDILSVNESEIKILLLLSFMISLFELIAWNKMLSLSISSTLAKADNISTWFWQYLFAGLLALIVMFSVRAVGVLLVTAMLIVPVAAARNLSGNMVSLFWLTILISLTSSVTGLLLSAQDWLSTASGATIILVECLWFAISCLWRKIRTLKYT